MTKYPFYAAMSHCSDLYGVDLDEDQFETAGMSAWNQIGNKDYQLYRVRLKPTADGEGRWFIQLPCNANAIEAITLDTEDFQEISATSNYLGMATSAIENQVEASKHMPAPLYQRGKLVNYYELGDKVYFTEPFRHVNVLYKGIYADEEGLPYLNWKEVEAVAAYCAYAHDYKSARKNKDQASLSLAQLQETKWKRLCAAARLPEEISQNTMNDILNASVSWNRKSYGRDYKPQY